MKNDTSKIFLRILRHGEEIFAFVEGSRTLKYFVHPFFSPNENLVKAPSTSWNMVRPKSKLAKESVFSFFFFSWEIIYSSMVCIFGIVEDI